MKYDNQLRHGIDQIILKMNDEYEKMKRIDWGLLEILDFVENEHHLQGRDDHEELAFSLFRYWCYNEHRLFQYKVDDLDMIEPGLAIVDLYLATYHLDDDIKATKTEGRRKALSLGDKERLQEIIIKIIGHPDGIFEGPGEEPYNFISARNRFCELSVDPNRDVAKKRHLLRVMRIFVEVDKKMNALSNRYYREWGELEKYVDDDDREVQERVRELLGILMVPTPYNMRLEIIEDRWTGKYYPNEDRTDIFEEEDVHPISWAGTDCGLYHEAYDEEEGDSFEGLGSLFG